MKRNSTGTRSGPAATDAAIPGVCSPAVTGRHISAEAGPSGARNTRQPHSSAQSASATSQLAFGNLRSSSQASLVTRSKAPARERSDSSWERSLSASTWAGTAESSFVEIDPEELEHESGKYRLWERDRFEQRWLSRQLTREEVQAVRVNRDPTEFRNMGGSHTHLPRNHGNPFSGSGNPPPHEQRGATYTPGMATAPVAEYIIARKAAETKQSTTYYSIDDLVAHRQLRDVRGSDASRGKLAPVMAFSGRGKEYRTDAFCTASSGSWTTE